MSSIESFHLKEHFAAAAHGPAGDVSKITPDVTITRAIHHRTRSSGTALLDKEHDGVGIEHTRRDAVALVTA